MAAETRKVEEGGNSLPSQFLDEDSLHERNTNKIALIKIESNLRKGNMEEKVKKIFHAHF